MIIKTKSGSKYLFEVNNGNLWFSKGLTEGYIISIKNLQIGSSMEIIYRKVGLYGGVEKSLSIIRTTEIISIT